MKTRKSWREKLADDKGLPRIGEIHGPMSTRWGAGTMVIPAPKEVDAMMSQVPKGKLTTINAIRAALARTHGVTMGCPITTGIFAWIAAHAAEEAALEGQAKTTPYWRTLKTGGWLNEKYPGGIARVRALLEAEGHEIEQKGQRFRVADFEKSLFVFPSGPAGP